MPGAFIPIGSQDLKASLLHNNFSRSSMSRLPGMKQESYRFNQTLPLGGLALGQSHPHLRHRNHAPRSTPSSVLGVIGHGGPG